MAPPSVQEKLHMLGSTLPASKSLGRQAILTANSTHLGMIFSHKRGKYFET